MADISEVMNEIAARIELSARLFEDLAAIEQKLANMGRTGKAEVEQRHKKLVIEAENFCQQVKPLVDQWIVTLSSIQVQTDSMKAGLEVLRVGSNLLENTPVFRTPANFLYGMNIYMHYLSRTFFGTWHSPVYSITSLNISKKTRELLFFYNGIATVGHLQHAIRTGSTINDLTPAGIIECQNELKDQGYAIFPISDNKKYWEQLTEQSQGLWKCVVNGRVSIFIELDYRQAISLSKYPCVVWLPGGSPVARLDI
jgi:hypothetical protein